MQIQKNSDNELKNSESLNLYFERLESEKLQNLKNIKNSSVYKI